MKRDFINQYINNTTLVIANILLLVLLAACNNNPLALSKSPTPSQPPSVIGEQKNQTAIVEIPTRTITLTKRPDPTLTPVMESKENLDNVYFVPENETDMSKVILAPSPIDNPEEYDEWIDAYLLKLRELNFDFSNISEATGEGSGINYQDSTITLSRNDWDPVASFKYEFEGQEVLVKVFPVKISGQGVFFCLSNPLPETELYKVTDPFYESRTNSELLFFYNATIGHRDREIFAKYLNISEDQFNALRRVLAGNGGENDYDVIQKIKFMLFTFR